METNSYELVKSYRLEVGLLRNRITAERDRHAKLVRHYEQRIRELEAALAGTTKADEKYRRVLREVGTLKYGAAQRDRVIKAMKLKKSKDTRFDLVMELEKLPQTPEVKDMIREAKAGEFHDYKNRKYDCGKTEAVGRLMRIGHRDLAQRVASGEFDEQPDEQDKKMIRAHAKEMGMTDEQCQMLLGV